MNKFDLILKLKGAHDHTNSQAAKVVDHFFGAMTAALANGNRIEIRGLCTI